MKFLSIYLSMYIKRYLQRHSKKQVELGANMFITRKIPMFGTKTLIEFGLVIISTLNKK